MKEVAKELFVEVINEFTASVSQQIVNVINIMLVDAVDHTATMIRGQTEVMAR